MAEVDTVDLLDAASATRTVATISKLIKTIGLPTDAKSTATDTTSVTLEQVLKQISASAQLSSTVAKQPALGTAGTASADVLSVQGVASMTALVVDPSAVTSPVKGGTASGSSIANAPVTIGGRAMTALPTAVADGQVVNAMFDKFGRLAVTDNPRDIRHTQKASLSNTTSETTIVTATSATFHDLYGLILANSGATTTKVDIRDTTGGTIIATIEVPTLETRGFMLPASSGIPQTTVNTNWTAQCAAATTAMEITSLYVDNK